MNTPKPFHFPLAANPQPITLLFLIYQPFSINK